MDPQNTQKKSSMTGLIPFFIYIITATASIISSSSSSGQKAIQILIDIVLAYLLYYVGRNYGFFPAFFFYIFTGILMLLSIYVFKYK